MARIRRAEWLARERGARRTCQGGWSEWNDIIEIEPVIDGDDRYARTTVYDLVADETGRQTKEIRDAYHSNDLPTAIELLHKFSLEGLFSR